METTQRPRLSESVQDYLINIVRLRPSQDEPVPLSALAKEMSISPVSVNDMCRKLQDQGLLIYRPYKGAWLTAEGQRYAYYVVRRHRLWEVFLVEQLGLAYDEAHEAANRLEHSTSDRVADQLDVFLSYPAVNPQGEPIPRADGELPACVTVSLAELKAGDHAHILRIDAPEPLVAALAEEGLRSGAIALVLALTERAILLRVGEGSHLSLARSLAEGTLVEALDDDALGACTLQPIADPGA